MHLETLVKSILAATVMIFTMSEPALAEENTIQIKLRSEARIGGWEILLGDIADVSAKDTLVSGRVMGETLGSPPGPGLARILRREDILAILLSRGYARDRIQISGSERIRLLTLATKIPGVEIQEKGASYLRNLLGEGGFDGSSIPIEEIEVLPRGDVAEVLIPTGRRGHGIRFSGIPSGPWDTNVRVTAAVTVDGRVVTRIPVSYSVKRYTTALATIRELRTGEALSSSNVHRIRIELSSVRQDLVFDESILKGAVVTRTIGAMSPLRSRDFTYPPTIKKGSLVAVTSISGALTIKTYGRAEEEGRMGKTISLRNENSGKVFRATVTGKNSAEIRNK